MATDQQAFETCGSLAFMEPTAELGPHDGADSDPRLFEVNADADASKIRFQKHSVVMKTALDGWRIVPTAIAITREDEAAGGYRTKGDEAPSRVG